MAGQQLGTQTGGQTSALFKDAAGWNTPNGMLSLVENYMAGMTSPIPVAKAEAAMSQILPKPQNTQMAQVENNLVHGIEKYAGPDGQVDRAGFLRYAADLGNNIQTLKPDLRLQKQAADMLTHFGIEDDKDGTMARGIARMTMGTVATTQALQRNNGDVNATMSEMMGKGPAALTPSGR